MRIARRWQWQESWWPTSWPSIVGSGIFNEQRGAAASLRRTWQRTRRISSVRGLPGLAVNATGRRERKLLMLPLISFETGRKTQTQSSVKTTRWSETANGSLVLSRIGTAAEKPHTRSEESKRITPALLPSASGELCPLDKDLSWKSRNRTSLTMSALSNTF